MFILLHILLHLILILPLLKLMLKMILLLPLLLLLILLLDLDLDLDLDGTMGCVVRPFFWLLTGHSSSINTLLGKLQVRGVPVNNQPKL